MSIFSEINEIFKSALKTGSYKQGIEQIGKVLGGQELKDEKILYKIGFLYDHLALEKEGREREELEDKAMSFYERALDVNKDYYNALWGIGRIYWHRNSKEALPYAEAAYEKHKEKTGNEDFSQNVGLVYESLGDHESAEVWLKKPLDSTDDPGMFSNLINLYRKTAQFEKAKKYAARAKELFDKKDESYKESLVGKMIEKAIESVDKPVKKGS